MTVFVTDRMLGLVGPGNDPVHTIEAPAVNEVWPPQFSVPAWSSTAMMPFSVVSPVFVTVAVTEIVAPISTLPLVAFVT